MRESNGSCGGEGQHCDEGTTAHSLLPTVVPTILCPAEKRCAFFQRATSFTSIESMLPFQWGGVSVSSSAPPRAWEYLPKFNSKSLERRSLKVRTLARRWLAGPGQGAEEEDVRARLELGSCRRPEPIDLGLHRALVLHGPNEARRRTSASTKSRGRHRPACGSPSRRRSGDISIEIVAAEEELKCARAADQAREPFSAPPPGTNPTPTSRLPNRALCRLAKRMSQASTNSLPMPRVRPRTLAMLTTGVDERRSTKSRQSPAPRAVQLPWLRRDGR